LVRCGKLVDIEPQGYQFRSVWGTLSCNALSDDLGVFLGIFCRSALVDSRGGFAELIESPEPRRRWRPAVPFPTL